MLRLWIVRQGFARSSSQQDCPAPGLSNTILAGLQDAKGALVAHLHQRPHAQLQHHRLLVGGKVAHILQNEEARPVVFAVGKVGRDEGILELGVLAMVKPVHTRESLARRSATEQVNLPSQGNHLPALIGFHPSDGVGEQEVAVVGEDCALGVVQLESLGGRLKDLHSPLAISNASHMQSVGETAAAREDVEAGKPLCHRRIICTHGTHPNLLLDILILLFLLWSRAFAFALATFPPFAPLALLPNPLGRWWRFFKLLLCCVVPLLEEEPVWAVISPTLEHSRVSCQVEELDDTSTSHSVKGHGCLFLAPEKFVVIRLFGRFRTKMSVLWTIAELHPQHHLSPLLPDLLHQRNLEGVWSLGIVALHIVSLPVELWIQILIHIVAFNRRNFLLGLLLDFEPA